MTPEKRELLRTLESRFTSGNDVPVTRAMITREEYEQLRSLLADREGFVTVPREPTPEMLRAASQETDKAAAHNYGGPASPEDIWHAMIAAATKEGT